MNTKLAAQLLHYELMKLIEDRDDAGSAALYLVDKFMEVVSDLDADNIKPDMQEKYDGYGNLMGYLSSLREQILEEL